MSPARLDHGGESLRSSGRPSTSRAGTREGYAPRGRGGHHPGPSSSGRDETGSVGGRSIQDRFQEYAAPSNSSVDRRVIQDYGRGGSSAGRGGPSRGRGGRGGGRRALRPQKSAAEQADYVRTRPTIGNEPAVKHAVSEAGRIELKPVSLVANYFPVVSRLNWRILYYHVEFEPPLERTGEKLALFRAHGRKLNASVGWTLFDGMALYTTGIIGPEV